MKKNKAKPETRHPHLIIVIRILCEFQQWAVHTTATWMSQQVPLERDIIAAEVPADHRCHMPWTIQVIFDILKFPFLSVCLTATINFLFLSR